MTVQNVVFCCIFAFVLSIVVESIRSKRLTPVLWQCLLLAAAIVLAVAVNTSETGVVSFGESPSPVGMVVLMLVATCLGISARFFFYLKDGFSWLNFIKPLCISPIILLPLIGSLQGIKELSGMQMVSFALLAFQNGFFWEVILERSKPQN